MLYIWILVTIIVIIFCIFSFSWSLKYFSERNKAQMATFFSFVIDNKLKRIRIADLSSMKRIQKIFNWPSLESGEWVSYESFSNNFLKEDSKLILSSLNKNENLKARVNLVESKNNSSKLMNLSLEIIMKENSFMILTNVISPKKTAIKPSGIKIKKIEKLLGKRTNNTVFYAMLLKDENDKQNFINQIYKVYPSFLKFLFDIYEFEEYIIFSFKKEEKKFFFDREKKWNTILDNSKISSCFISMVKLEQADMSSKEKLIEFQNKLEYATFRTISENKAYFLKNLSEEEKIQIENFVSVLEYFKTKLNLQNLNLVKNSIQKNGKRLRDLAYIDYKFDIKNFKIKNLAYIPKYRIALNDLYLKKTLLNPINKKIIDVEKENFQFILKHKSLFMKNESILNFEYNTLNIDFINNYCKENFWIAIEIKKIDDTFFDVIKNAKFHFIIVGEDISTQINNSRYLLWLSYLKTIAKQKNIKLIYKNPATDLESRAIDQVGMEYWFNQ